MDNTHKLSPAQVTAAELLADFNLLETRMNDDSHYMLNIYKHPDFYKAADGLEVNVATMSESQKDALWDEYYYKYIPDELPLEPYKKESTPTKIKYMRAILTGIAEGRITTGDSTLGSMLLEFTSHMKAVAKEELHRAECAPDPKTTLPVELAELYFSHFRSIENQVIQGAGQGLFTSGQSIAPAREQSIADKYAGARASHLQSKGLA